MWWEFNCLSLRGNLEGILEGVSDIRDTNGEVVCGNLVNIQTEYG